MPTRRGTLISLATAPTLGPIGLLAGCRERTIPYSGAFSHGTWGYTLFANGKFYGQLGFGDGAIDRPFRVASVTKMAVAELGRRLHARGDVDLDSDVSDLIGVTIRHPNHLQKRITIRHLLSHRSGVRDPDIYWMAHPGDIRELLTNDIWESGGQPGVTFRYSNLGYGLAATAIEAATNERFDHLFTRHIADPMGLDIGLNWSGVSAGKRAAGMPGVRNKVVQVDDTDVLISDQPAILMREGASLETYTPGQNGTLFSPQGGLRASLYDMVKLTEIIVLQQPELWKPTWQWDGIIRPNGPSEDAHFIAFGEGLYIYPKGPLGRDTVPWVGHHGTAYGINCGTWLRANPNRPSFFAHAALIDNSNLSGMMGHEPNHSRAAWHALGYGASSLRLLDTAK